MMNIKTLFLLVILFACVTLNAQKEAAIWYFGENAGLDFNSGTPVVINNGQLNTNEGCASISNESGELLFYTDGITVWDKNHNIMPNGSGLLGDPSSTQSAIITPKPNNADIYYIFTVDVEAGTNGLRFSELDLNLNGGNGDITSIKNVLLKSPVTEKISAISHANGTDLWVVTHAWNNNDFLSYKITETGVNTIPIVSSVGSIHTGSTSNSIGYLKMSPNGEKIAIAKWSNNSFVEVLDFDDTTGLVSNPILINNVFYNGDTAGAYGIEFSPDGNLLYVSDTNISGSSKIHQFNISLNDQISIINSDNIIYDGSDFIAALQLAIDGKIYLANGNSEYVDVINNPNNIGATANYNNRDLFLNGRLCIFGLPPFIQSFFSVGIKTEDTCFGDSTQFSVNSSDLIDSIIWNFGDGNTSILENPIHNYSLPGTYTVTVSVSSGTDVRNISKDIIISEIPIASDVDDYYLCDDVTNDGVEVFDLSLKNNEVLGTQSSTYFDVAYFKTMQNGIDHTEILNLNYANSSQGEEIFVKIYNNQNRECYDITSFKLYVDLQPIANPILDLILCDDITNDGLDLVNLRQFDAKVLNGQSNSDFNITYHLSQLNANDNIQALPDDFQTLNNPQPIYVRIENINNIDCYDTNTFNIKIDGYIEIGQADNLFLCDDATNDNVESFDLTQRDTQIGQNVTIPYRITYHENLDDATLNTNSIIGNYNNIRNPQEVFYRLENAVNEDCFKTGSFFIEVMEKPEIQMDDILYICSNEEVTLTADLGYDEYLWSTGETTQEITVNQTGFYEVTLTKHYNTAPFVKCSSSKTVEVIESDEAILINIEVIDWSLGSNELTILIEGIGDYEYSIDDILYQDSNIFTNLKVGDYTVYIRDKNGCGTINKKVFVLFYPKYFTPNGDGYHDLWQLYFANTESDITIKVLDKYGKLLKELSPKSKGWDGTYNDKPLPASDYWFVVNRPSKNEQYKGHFTLKR